MLVPVVLAASTSPSPTNVPLPIDTVALATLTSSGSLTTNVLDSVVGPACSSVYCAVVAPLANVGASLTLVMLMVDVAVPMLLPPPLSSTTVQVTVRLGSEPKSVGFSPAEKVTSSN